MTGESVDELQRDLDAARQLLQAGVLLAEAVLAGDDVRGDLQKWVDAVNRLNQP